jgi:hypothetical protein
MTDKVTCDRKGCDEWLYAHEQYAHPSPLTLPQHEPRRFLTLRGVVGGTASDLHFCSLECLATWSSDTIVAQNVPGFGVRTPPPMPGGLSASSSPGG